MRKIYICTPLKLEKFKLEKISKELLNNPDCFAFIPPTGQLVSKTVGAKLDKQMIEHCDELWAFGPIARDCCWEVGFATGLGKVVKIFVDESNQDVVDNDWMTLLGAKLIFGE